MVIISATIDNLRQKAQNYRGEGFEDRIEAIETEFRYMSDFMLQGGKDPKRAILFEELKARLRHIAYDLDVRSTLMEIPYIKVWQKQLLTRDTSAETLQTLLLNDTDNKQHHETLYLAFMALLTSYHWGKQQVEEWTMFLSAPQGNATDQATLVSALTLSTLEHFDKHKAMCLANVYSNSKDELIKQRALIGCLLALSRVSGDDMKDIRIPILDALKIKGENESEQMVLETFMQMMTCANVDNDAREIKNNLIPNILRNQPFEIKDGTIIEKGTSSRNEDTQEADSYDPDAENEALDAMEKSVKKMMKMQSDGSDIFFAGFSQMKRFPFFQKHVNWFIPFYKEHPDLPENVHQHLNTKFIERVTSRGPFCESDKYSFVIGFTTAMSNIPENIKQMMEDGEMGPLGMHGEDEDMRKPSLLRLQYLQDLYRFYRLCPLAEKMFKPFEQLGRCHMGIATATHTSDKEKRNLCLFLLKKNSEMQTLGTVSRLLNRFNDLDCFDRHYCHAELKLASNDYTVAISLYNKCMELNPSDKSCMRSLARAHYLNKDYEKAAFYYDALHTLQPDRLSYILNYCMAMTMHGKADIVLNELFRLDLEQPDNTNITNMLTWTLLHAGKTEQALRAAERIIQRTDVKKNFSVCLNTAYAFFANGQMLDGIEVLKSYQYKDADYPTLLTESMTEDASLLSMYDIGEAEISIIAEKTRQ